MLKIINKRKYFYIFSTVLIAASLFALMNWGLKFGIDFTGGTQMEITFSKDIPEREIILEKLKDLELDSLSFQKNSDGLFVIHYTNSDEKINDKVFEKIKELDEEAIRSSVNFIGSSISNQLKKSAVQAILIAILGIAIYIAFAFRKISQPVASWKYGLGAILALSHDIIIVIGIFSFLGKFYNIEVGVPFIAALLTILGYSVNDTIVVYDRTRENLTKASSKESFENVVNKSLNETLTRSINTSLTVLIVLLALIFLGEETIRYFSIALSIGVVFGTYSSIYIASALLVTSHKLKIKS